MSQRYSVLPSDLLRRADSLDYMVYDVASAYQMHVQNKAQGKVDQKMYDPEELQKAYDKGKQYSGKTSSK